MKVLILQDDFPPNHIGGSGSISYLLAQALRLRAHEVEVVTATQDKKKAGTMEYQGMRVHSVYATFSKRFGAYKALWNRSAMSEVQKILSVYKPDVVHAHSINGYLSYGCLVAAKRSHARVVFTAHDVMTFNYSKLVEFIDPKDLAVHESYDYSVSLWYQFRQMRFRYNPLRNAVIRYILRNYVDHLTAVSGELRKALEQNGIPGAIVIHNGIDVDPWKPDSARDGAFKEKHLLGDSVILFGGRISGVKGTNKILEALVEIRKQVPGLQLLVIGHHDDMFKRMQKKAEQLGVSESIAAPGWLSGEDLKAAYHACAVVAIPTLSFDSFPTMNLEAFACKKPVVATCFGGAREIVEDGVSGYIVNPYNVSMLASKLTDLLVDRSKTARFGDAGYDRLRRFFTLEKQAQEFEKLYRS